MSDLSDLYQEVILDHNRRPHNFRVIEPASAKQEGYNPLCGDRLTLYLRIDGDVIQDVAFQGSGCAISKASASMMTTAVIGQRPDEAEALFQRLHAVLTDNATPNVGDAGHGLGKLAVFVGVREFPSRVKCATLAWHTLHAALSGTAEPVSTE